MRPTGVVRKLDELGRIVIPKDLRKRFNLNEKDALEIYVEDNMIILKKYEPFCMFCGNSEDLFTFNGRIVCKECAKKLKTVADNI